MDLEVTDYADLDDLARYVHGSAAVIGLQMLPVLGTVVPRRGGRARARPRSASRSSSPTSCATSARTSTGAGSTCRADELAAFGVDRELLAWCRRTGGPTPRVRRGAGPPRGAHPRGLPARRARGSRCWSRCRAPACARAFTLYRGILDEIEAAEYAVLHRRVVVPPHRRAAGVARALVSAR